MKRTLVLVLLAGGCWDGERSSLPLGSVDFEPESGDVEAWSVSQQTVDLACPDGDDARIYFVHPTEPTGPLPTVVLFHDGAFDFVDDTTDGPLAGQTYQEVGRLDVPFAVRQTFATLGMYPEPLEEDEHTGALAQALAAEGVALVLPVNCWGDLWHNKPATRENDFYGDRMFRAGGAIAEWSWRSLTEDGFAEALGIDVPFEADRQRLGMVGLGEGGRAVGELLANDARPGAVVIEGHNDDLAAWQAATPLVETGLARIFFTEDDRMERAFSRAEALPPTLWIHSTLDPLLASGSQDRVLSRLTGPEHRIIDRADTSHLRVNADPVLATEAVGFLLGAF